MGQRVPTHSGVNSAPALFFVLTFCSARPRSPILIIGLQAAKAKGKEQRVIFIIVDAPQHEATPLVPDLVFLAAASAPWHWLATSTSTAFKCGQGQDLSEFNLGVYW